MFNSISNFPIRFYNHCIV